MCRNLILLLKYLRTRKRDVTSQVRQSIKNNIHVPTQSGGNILILPFHSKPNAFILDELLIQIIHGLMRRNYFKIKCGAKSKQTFVKNKIG